MKEFYKNISNALAMLDGLEQDLNIRHLTPNELKVFYTIISRSYQNRNGSNISDIVENSGMSRSTVYKTLKKLSDELKLCVGLCQIMSDFKKSSTCSSFIPEK